jgi:heme exporter protein B
MAGLSRSFVQEQESGTLFTLRLYAGAQAVLFGKLIFNVILLTALAVLIIPLFMIFLNLEIPLWGALITILILGNIGIATASTMTAAMVSRAQGQGALFTVLTFPIILPQFLSSIGVTTKLLSAVMPSNHEIMFMAGYDGVILLVASILFDYLWYD